MPEIHRQKLENYQSIEQAVMIVDKVRQDIETYSQEAFLRRQGIIKMVEEEYVPLVLVAELVSGDSLRLFSEANQGPDGEIQFTDSNPLNAQITCSHEGLARAQMRINLSQNGAVLTEISADEVDVRYRRILSAFRSKEDKFYKGTNILIILDAPANLSHLSELKPMIRQALAETRSKYENIFVVYGDQAEQVK